MHKKNINNFWNNSEQASSFGEKKPAKFLTDFFSKIDNPSNKKVLDIGCGGGRNTESLYNLGFDVFACDLHDEMVKFTKQRISRLNKEKTERIISASMLSLPYADKIFDYIISNGVFHNINCLEEFNKAIEETTRVLKNNGKLVLNMFSAKIIDPNLKLSKDFIYITPQKLPMVLLPKQTIEKLLLKNNLRSISKITETATIISTGKRSVLRGIFQKVEE